MSVDKILSDMILAIYTGLFCIGVAEVTFREKEEQKKYWSKWTIAILLYMIASVGMEAGALGLVAYLEENVSGISDSFFYVIIYLTLNVIKRMKPVFFVLLAFLWIYRRDRNVKIFTAVLSGLIVQIIIHYFIPIVQIPFFGQDDGSGFRTEPPIMISLVLYGVVFFVVFLIYWRVFSKKMRKFLEISQKNIQSFLKIPVCSSVFFVLLISMLATFGYTPLNVYGAYVQVFIVVFGCIILTYIVMYWGIFKGIRLSERKMRNQADFDVARKLQTSILPCDFPAYPDREEFQIYATMDAAKEVGGDFYDFFLIDETHLAVVIADVSGKGIPAALFMMTARTLIKNLFMSGKEPGKVMEEANEALCENNEEEMFVTVFSGVLETDTGRFIYANAGHNPPFLSKEGESYELWKVKPGFILGGMEGIRYRQQEIMLQAGDTLYLYTDGVTEALNQKEELYSERRLKELLNSDRLRESTIEEVLHAVREDIDRFADGAQQADDITMLILRITK